MMLRQKLVYCLILWFSLSVFCGTTMAQAENNAPYDVQEHWAEPHIQRWLSYGLLGGYPDGCFHPERTISRAEFLALVNRVWASKDKVTLDAVPGKQIEQTELGVQKDFPEASAEDWFARDMAIAVAMGYAYSDSDGAMRPSQPISRQEIALVLAKLLASSAEEQAQAVNSYAAIQLVTTAGYMGGYPDGSFRPDQHATRAEAIAILDRMVGTLYQQAGVYGPEKGMIELNGNVTIVAAGVTLQNTEIKGDLFLTAGIGQGQVTLHNVQVKGSRKIAAGVTNVRDDQVNNAADFISAKKKKDKKAPIFSEGYPRAVHVQKQQFDLVTQANETGWAYYVVLPFGSSEPSVEQMRAGQDAAGQSGPIDSLCQGYLELIRGEEEGVTITELTPDTVYDVYFVAEDVRGNIQNTLTKITVTTEIVPVTGVALTPTQLTLFVGEGHVPLTAEVAPSSATNKELSWYSSNEEVVLVTDGLLTPVATGTAFITVTTVDGGYTATSEIRVVTTVGAS